jgi:hypothetical protein
MLDRLAQRYSVLPSELTALSIPDFSINCLVAAAGNEQDERDRE